MIRIPWDLVLAEAAIIVRGYSTGVTLRQLHYRLVSRPELSYPNSQNAYKGLSDRTANLRRRGEFPALIDRGRTIHRPMGFGTVTDYMHALGEQWRRDRTANQDVSVYLGVEKNGMVAQLQAWFGDRGLPVLALGGYSSATYEADVVRDVYRQDRPAVLLYGGDFDCSGVDIDRDFIEHTGCWDKVERVALSFEQVLEYGLPVNPGKETDSRLPAFIDTYGVDWQVEVDALDPNDLQALFEAALEPYWDEAAYQAVLAQEEEDRALLAVLARQARAGEER